MSDQLIAETSTRQHATLTTDKYPCPWWDLNPQSQQASGISCDEVIKINKLKGTCTEKTSQELMSPQMKEGLSELRYKTVRSKTLIR
jgi:hypothetical protein